MTITAKLLLLFQLYTDPKIVTIILLPLILGIIYFKDDIRLQK